MLRSRAMLAALFLLAACGNSLGSQPPVSGALCQSDLGCGPGEVCSAGLCVRAADGAFPIDPWPTADGGPRADGGAPDGGRPDGGPPLDGGPAWDGGIVVDGGAADGGPLQDGGLAQDGGPLQ